MNTFIKFALFFLFCLSLSSWSKEKVINSPAYLDSNTQHLVIDRIELTDTATILYMEAYHLPNYWVMVSSGTYLKGNDTERRYQLIKSEGFELDKEIFMPENGNISFVLFFEPLDKKEESFDFVEYPGEDQAYIAEVRLSEPKTKIKAVLKGTVVDRPQSSCLYLASRGTDFRVNPFKIIPIHNGTFEYPVYLDAEDLYELTFPDEYYAGAWRPIVFIVEDGIIDFTLYPMDDWSNNIISTKAPLNNLKKEFQQQLDSLFDRSILASEFNSLWDSDRYYSEAYKSLLQKIEETDNDKRDKLYAELNALGDSEEGLTPEAWVLRQKQEQLFQNRKNYELEFIKTNPSISGYLRLLEMFTEAQLSGGRIDPAPYVAVFEEIYKPLYPDHPLTDKIQLFASGNSIKKGGRYIDFTAPDINGNPVTLSKHIKGKKVALIDLWASWCGPCRRKAISMIPVYEEYKDKGFTVLGVARESKAQYMIDAVKRDGYPWLNLLELNDENRIWAKYGAGNGGGATYLVDDSGIILAINPDAEEVRKILVDLLK